MTIVILGITIITDNTGEDNMEKKEKTSISIDKEVLNKIREKAREENRNVSNLTEIIYKDFLERDTLKKE